MISAHSVIMYPEAIQDFDKRFAYRNYLVISFPSEEHILFSLCMISHCHKVVVSLTWKKSTLHAILV